jgi:hypothetical protein
LEEGVELLKDPKLKVLLFMLVVAALTYFIAFYGQPAQPQTEEKAKERLEGLEKRFNYTQGERPDYGFAEDVFRNLPPLPQDFWSVDQKFQNGEITDYVELGEQYWKQPEFYPTFENNLEFMKNPEPGRIYAYGIGAYPGDIGVDAFPDSQFTVASFYFSSWLVQTYQGIRIEDVYPERTEIPTPDLQEINFTVTQDPGVVGKYFNVTFDPELFVIGPTSPAFDENWTRKVKVTVTVSNETPKGTYVIGVDAVPPPPELSEQWLKTYKAYSDAGAFRIGRAPFQIVVFVN